MEQNTDIEIPQYFLCPISLQIMRDPVTTITGITYDRESIEQWLRTMSYHDGEEESAAAYCPVTKQPLPRNSDLTPNHMLRRLIQAWCNAHVEYGIDRIPTPKSPLSKSFVFKLKRNLNVPNLRTEALQKLKELALENDKNRKCMAEAGVSKAMITFTLKGFKEGKIHGISEALSVLNLIWIPTNENKQLVEENSDLIEAITWVLRNSREMEMENRTHAMRALKLVSEVASTRLLEQLDPSFFSDMMKILKNNKFSSLPLIKSVLHVLIQSCPWGRNRMKIIESGAVFELVEVELDNNIDKDKKISEMVMCLLAQLCSCADGRAQLLKHAGSLAVISKRILRISPATDDQALHIFGLITRFSATHEVLIEMLRVGAVSKLCMVLQADCEPYLKKQAREILRLHSNVWNNSPCIQVYLLTRHNR